jgi:hypothetical protein
MGRHDLHISICPKNKEYLPSSHDLKPAHYIGDGQKWHSVVVVFDMAV